MEKTGISGAMLSDGVLRDILRFAPKEMVRRIFGEFVNCFLADFRLGPVQVATVSEGEARYGEGQDERFGTMEIGATDKDGRRCDIVLQVRPRDMASSYLGIGTSWITSHLDLDPDSPRGVVMVLCEFDIEEDYQEDEFVKAKALCLSDKRESRILGMVPVIYINVPRAEAIFQRRLEAARRKGELGFDSGGAGIGAERRP